MLVGCSDQPPRRKVLTLQRCSCLLRFHSGVHHDITRKQTWKLSCPLIHYIWKLGGSLGESRFGQVSKTAGNYGCALLTHHLSTASTFCLISLGEFNADDSELDVSKRVQLWETSPVLSACLGENAARNVRREKQFYLNRHHFTQLLGCQLQCSSSGWQNTHRISLYLTYLRSR